MNEEEKNVDFKELMKDLDKLSFGKLVELEKICMKAMIERGIKSVPEKVSNMKEEISKRKAIIQEKAKNGIDDAIKEIKTVTTMKLGAMIDAGLMPINLAKNIGKKIKEGTLTIAKNFEGKYTDTKGQLQEKLDGIRKFFRDKAGAFKDKVIDTAETVALYGMEAKDHVVGAVKTVAGKAVDTAETVALYGMEAKDHGVSYAKYARNVTRKSISHAKDVVAQRKDKTNVGIKSYLMGRIDSVIDKLDGIKDTIRESRANDQRNIDVRSAKMAGRSSKEGDGPIMA